nr:hypothetical protein [Alysiella crassa]UOP07375.1 hypothetical protein LVJ80_02790 [Alysiella crassa]
MCLSIFRQPEKQDDCFLGCFIFLWNWMSETDGAKSDISGSLKAAN